MFDRIDSSICRSDHLVQNRECCLKRCEFDQSSYCFDICISALLDLLASPTQTGQVEVCMNVSFSYSFAGDKLTAAIFTLDSLKSR